MSRWVVSKSVVTVPGHYAPPQVQTGMHVAPTSQYHQLCPAPISQHQQVYPAPVKQRQQVYPAPVKLPHSCPSIDQSQWTATLFWLHAFSEMESIGESRSWRSGASKYSCLMTNLKPSECGRTSSTITSCRYAILQKNNCPSPQSMQSKGRRPTNWSSLEPFIYCQPWQRAPHCQLHERFGSDEIVTDGWWISWANSVLRPPYKLRVLAYR